MLGRFLATPAFRCHAPAKGFRTAEDAARYAREAAGTFRVGYAVWDTAGGRPRCLERVPAAVATPAITAVAPRT